MRCALLLGLGLLAAASAFRTPLAKLAPFRLHAEDGVSLRSLPDVSVDALWLGDSVRTWLDEEYIPMDIHKQIGAHTRATLWVCPFCSCAAL